MTVKIIVKITVKITIKITVKIILHKMQGVLNSGLGVLHMAFVMELGIWYNTS